MAAHRRRAAVLNGPESFELLKAEALLVPVQKAVALRPDNVGHLQGWPAHFPGAVVEVVRLRDAGDRQVFKRVNRFFQMPSRQVQVDAGGLQIRMSHQDLDGRQIGTVLQQMSGETMPEHVGRDALFETRMTGSFRADVPDLFVR